MAFEFRRGWMDRNRKDGSGKGVGRKGGLRRNKNTGGCEQGGEGFGRGGGKGLGKYRLG